MAGNSGKLPASYEFLEGVGRLAEDPETLVQATFNKATGKFDLRAIPRVSDVIMPDGTKARRIEVDVKDVGQIPKIIQRERKRHGFAPLSAEQLATEVQNSTKSAIIVATENPKLLRRRSFDFSYVRHALIKIAYELAFLWLGEAYLDDPSAAELRTAICTPDPNSTNYLPVCTTDEAFEAFYLWPEDKTNHLAFAFAGDDGIAIAVRIFDAHAAVVWVTKDAARYLTGDDAKTRLRFLSINPATGQMVDVPMEDEWCRFGMEIASGRREVPRRPAAARRD